ncbi:MAG TPA: hypothetical protein VJ939_05330, partial [Bacteroidales bacterium]|nr:hypothetical protein [Bacteroidales bacterium]
MKTLSKKNLWAFFFAILFCRLLAAQVYEGDVELKTQAAVDTFNYTSVTGNMRIIGSPDITSLDALSGLTSIGGNLQVLCSVSNFNGLDNLVSIGGYLDISFMGVTDMTGLGSLETIGGDFIFDMASFTSFNGLTNIREIGGRLYCCGNTNNFTNFEGLESLTTLGSLIIGDGCMYPPNNIESLYGLSGLTTITGSLRIIETKLGGLHDLSNLNSVGNMFISGNPFFQGFGLYGLEVVYGSITIRHNSFLWDLDGLHNLNTVGGDLTIADNAFPQGEDYGGLASFCGLYNLLSNEGLEGSYNVYDNGINPTIQQIIDGCPGAFDPPVIWNVSASPDTICAGESSTLEITSASRGDATDWYWYSGECGSTPAGTGRSITVSPASTTTYFVRGEGWKIMDPVECEEITVTVNLPPVAGSLNKTPDNDAVCEGTNVSAILTPGTDGDGTDVLEFRTCVGTDCSDWSDYTSADEISTTGLTSVEIRTKRLGGIFDDSNYSTVSWAVHQLPHAPITKNVTVCWDGMEHSATASLSGSLTEEIVWYTSSNGSIITTAPTGTDAGTYTAYAASKYPETGCESTTRTEVTLTINPLPLPLVLTCGI